MKASAPKRNYFRIQKNLLRLSKTALLSLFIFATVLGNIAPAFADDTYKAYETLFNSTGTLVPKSSSEFKYQGPLINSAQQQVDGLQFSFKWEFNRESEVDAEKSWDHITFPYDDEQFIVRLCSTVDPTKCLYSKVPYREKAAPGFWDNITSGSTWLAMIANGIGAPGAGTAANLSWKLEYQNKTKQEIRELTVIFRKLDDRLFVKQRAINIIGLDWFTIGTGGQITKSTVPWLTLAQNGYDSAVASFWYCAGKPSSGTNINPTNAYERTTGTGTPNTNIERFGDLCSRNKQGQAADFTYIGTENGGTNFATVPQGQRGRSFFKIAEVPVKLPKTFTDAQQQNAQIQSATLDQTDIAAGEPAKLPGCGVFDEKSSIMGCVAQGVYYVIYVPIQWFAGLLGNVFDFFLGYSLDDSSYRAEFAVRGWQIVRDFSNIFFIIILVYTGLSTVVGGKANMKQVVPALILNALLINFSLFATRVIIDISNVVARVFYNSMEVCSGKCEKDSTTGQITNPADTIGGYRQLSLSIVSGFNPQQLMSVDSLNKARALKSTQGGAVGSATTGTAYEDTETYSAGTIAGYFIIVTLISALIMVGIAMMFWKTAFMFLGRVIGLYVAMIFAPFAVLTKGNMPIVGNIKELSWTKWLQDLTNYAILAPLFIFFLYIIYSFLNTDFLKATKDSIGNSSFFTNVISVTVPMLIIYFMIQQGVGIAKKYAGTIGEMVQAGATKVAGFAGGAALGVGGLVGGRIIGGAASKLNESRAGSWLRDKAPDNKLARIALGGLKSASAGSYDVRQTAIGKGLFKQMGVDTDQKGMNALKSFGLGLGTDQRKGGYEADVKRRKEQKENNAKLMEEKMSDEQIKKFNDRQKKKYQERTDKITDAAIAAHTGKTKEDVEIMKKTNPTAYHTEKAAALAADPAAKAKVDNVTPPKEMKTVSELNSARREGYAKNLEKGGLITQGLNWLGTKGKVGEITSSVLGATLGAAIGEGVATAGDKKAAKEIKEKNKIEKDLAKIEETLKKGFQDLIALEDFQNSPKFTALSQPEKDDIIKYGVIQQVGPNKGKHLYDILDPSEQKDIDEKIKTLNDDSNPANKSKREHYEEMVKTIEGSRFDMKIINAELRTRQKAMMDSIKNNAAPDVREKLKKSWIEKIEEKTKAEKHLKTWQDINKHRAEQKKKLKGEEAKN